MAKKKVAKKKSARKTTAKAPRKKAATKKKAAGKKKGAAQSAKATPRSAKSKAKKPARKARKRAAARSRKTNPKTGLSRGSNRSKTSELLERRTVTIEAQQSGDLIVTEPAGGSIRVHHTVHPDAETTPIPGKSYDDLHDLGPGTHEIESKRTLEPAEGAE